MTAYFQQFIRRCLQYKKENRIDVISLSNDEYLKPKTKHGLGSTLDPKGLLWFFSLAIQINFFCRASPMMAETLLQVSSS